MPWKLRFLNSSSSKKNFCHIVCSILRNKCIPIVRVVGVLNCLEKAWAVFIRFQGVQAKLVTFALWRCLENNTLLSFNFSLHISVSSWSCKRSFESRPIISSSNFYIYFQFILIRFSASELADCRTIGAWLNLGVGDIVGNQERSVLSGDSFVVVEHHHLISEAWINCVGGRISKHDIVALSKIWGDLGQIAALLRW